MGEINLTKSARKSIRLIYKEYKRRIRSGVPKEKAIIFDPVLDFDLKEKVKNDRSLLKDRGLLKLYVIGGFAITDEGICYCENRMIRAVINFSLFILQFRP